jgi:hypothetical protein
MELGAFSVSLAVKDIEASSSVNAHVPVPMRVRLYAARLGRPCDESLYVS